MKKNDVTHTVDDGVSQIERSSLRLIELLILKVTKRHRASRPKHCIFERVRAAQLYIVHNQSIF